MRFKINVSIQGHQRFLPTDYQYAMASAIYKLIAEGDEAYSKFLHHGGFSGEGLKNFKYFSFSPLSLRSYTHWKDNGVFELHVDTLSFKVGFMADKSAEAFIKGMFAEQKLEIGDRFNTLHLEVIGIEVMQAPFFTPTMYYRCLSPLTIALRDPGRRNATYLAPDDPRFGELLIENMISKFTDMFVPDRQTQSEEWNFELRSVYRSRLITINPHTIQETKVPGYLFDFSLTAPGYIHEMGYYAGFGMNNEMGFGTVIVMD